MVEKRINNTDPVVQVRLCVMVGNFHGACKKVRLAAGFVYPNAEHPHKSFRRVYARPSTAPTNSQLVSLKDTSCYRHSLITRNRFVYGSGSY